MKTLFSLSLLSTAFAAQPASADVAWTTTPFWRAPYLTTLSLAVVPDDGPSLSRACQRFAKLTKNLGDKPDGELLNDLRVVSADPDDTAYVNTRFHLQPERSDTLLKQAVTQANSSLGFGNDRDPLPHFTNQLDSLVPENKLARLSLAPDANADTFTALSRKAKLNPLPVQATGGEFFSSNRGGAIAFGGLDSACDFLAGKAAVSADSFAQVRISETSGNTLTAFYSRVAVKALEAVAKRKSVAGRAAYLGFLTGDLFTSETGTDTDAGLNALGNFAERFFDPATMEPNDVWIHPASSSPPFLAVPMVQEVAVKLNFRVENQ